MAFFLLPTNKTRIQSQNSIASFVEAFRKSRKNGKASMKSL